MPLRGVALTAGFASLVLAAAPGAAGEFYRQSIDVTAHTVKLGVNRRFGVPLAGRN